MADGQEQNSEAGGEAVVLDSDLFFVVKIADTLKYAGLTTRTVRTERDFAQALAARRPAVVLVNTAARGVDYAGALAVARDAGIPSVAYGAHVDIATQAAARAAGATVVVSNSRLSADLPGIVARALRRGTEAAELETDVAAEPGEAPSGDPHRAPEAPDADR